MTIRRIEASRANGRKSQGPTSAAGKSRVRMNALKSGLFAQETVIPSAGETQKKFDEILAAAKDQFESPDLTTAVLVEEFVTSYWRLARVRRCEAAEIKKRLNTAMWRLYFDRIVQVNAQKNRFLRHIVARRTAEGCNPAVIAAAIEDARVELNKSAAGLQFLTDLIKEIEAAVKVRGYLTPTEEVTLGDVCGIGDDFVHFCVRLNTIAKAEMAKSGIDKKTATFETNKQIMLFNFTSEIRRRRIEAKILEQLETAENDAKLATFVLPPTDCAERIHRAEAALQRSCFKALDRLLYSKAEAS
jgi:hypothetical protein